MRSSGCLRAIIGVTVSLGWAITAASGGQVVVKWIGPDGDPVLNTDYELTGTPPINVTLKSTEGGGVQVIAYQLGWEGTGPAAIGDVTTNWTGPAHDISVEVGSLAAFPVADLKSIQVDRQASDKYSNIRLELTGSVTPGPVKCYEASTGGSAGAGGRLSGTVAVRTRNIACHAIGEGADQPGLFDAGIALGSTTDTVEIDELEANAEIKANDLLGLLRINGSMNGNLTFKSVAQGRYPSPDPDHFLEDYAGKIEVLGSTLTGTISVVTPEGVFIPAGLLGGEISINEPGSVFTGQIIVKPMLLICFQLEGDPPGPQVCFESLIKVNKLSGTVSATTRDNFNPPFGIQGRIEIATHVLPGGSILLPKGLTGNGISGGGVDFVTGVHVGGNLEQGALIRVGGVGLEHEDTRIGIDGSVYGNVELGTNPANPEDVPLRGEITVGTDGQGGDLIGKITHCGVIDHDPDVPAEYGSITVHGDLSGQYVQSECTEGTGGDFVDGTITVDGDITSTGKLSLLGQLRGTGAAPGAIAVGGSMHGRIELFSGMKDASVHLNTDAGSSGVVDGTLRVGNPNLPWEDVGSVISLNDIHVLGDFVPNGLFLLQGCFDTIPGAYTMNSLCFDGLSTGTILKNFCAGATVTFGQQCP